MPVVLYRKMNQCAPVDESLHASGAVQADDGSHRAIHALEFQVKTLGAQKAQLLQKVGCDRR